MGGDRLDQQLEPVAQFVLLIIILLIVAAISSYVLMKLATRRRERRHLKVSNSRRMKDTSIDLFSKPAGAGDTASRREGKHRSRRSSSSTHTIDILKRPDPSGTEPGPRE
jgi:hypothetical protein